MRKHKAERKEFSTFNFLWPTNSCGKSITLYILIVFIGLMKGAALAGTVPLLMRQRRKRGSPYSTPRASSAVDVRYVDGRPVEVLSIPQTSSPKQRTHVVIIPGNPGIPEYYHDFCQELSRQLPDDTSVSCLGLLAHSAKPLFPFQKWFALHEQEQHCVRFIESLPPGQVLLVGHSIGAHIALRSLYERPDRVEAVVGVQPYLENNAESPQQRLCRWLVGFPPAVALACLLAGILGALPAWARGALLRPRLRSLGLESRAVEVTLRALRASTVLNYVLMGRSELEDLAAEGSCAARPHLGIEAHSAALSVLGPRVALVYGEEADIWAPPQHMRRMQREAPAVSYVVDGRLPHMFCVAEGSSHAAARLVARLGLALLALSAARAEPVALQ